MTDTITTSEDSSRRDVLAASLLGAIPMLLGAAPALASPLDPTQTVIRPPDALKWIPTTRPRPSGAENAARQEREDAMTDTITTSEDSSRRDVLAASLLGAIPMLLGAAPALASPLDPTQTVIRPPDALKWIPTKGYPEGASDRCALTGDLNGSGLYFTLVRWWPGYMSAPHHYTTDRFCMVVSGTWWCNSGADFDPASCVPVKAGSYVHRVAGTPHYDGVIAGEKEPAVIAICGIAPINYALVDPSKPGWRKV